MKLTVNPRGIADPPGRFYLDTENEKLEMYQIETAKNLKYFKKNPRKT